MATEKTEGMDLLCPYDPLIFDSRPCGAAATHRVEWTHRPVGANVESFGACEDHAWRYANNPSFVVTPLEPR